MGLICSCLGHDEPGPILQLVVNKCKSVFHRGQVEADAPSNEAGSAATAPLTDNTYTDSQQNGVRELVKPPNKTVTQTGDNEPFRRITVVQQGLKTLAKETEENKLFFPCSDDEDVCPTCLEEYDEENPKIVTQCNHVYHLACILEWMERSTSCPVCGKLMVFEQMN